MTATSPGSQPNPQQFLTAYALGVEDNIAKLRGERVAQEGDYALKGKESQDIRTQVANKVIQIPGLG